MGASSSVNNLAYAGHGTRRERERRTAMPLAFSRSLSSSHFSHSAFHETLSDHPRTRNLHIRGEIRFEREVRRVTSVSVKPVSHTRVDRSPTIKSYNEKRHYYTQITARNKVESEACYDKLPFHRLFLLVINSEFQILHLLYILRASYRIAYQTLSLFFFFLRPLRNKVCACMQYFFFLPSSFSK